MGTVSHWLSGGSISGWAVAGQGENLLSSLLEWESSNILVGDAGHVFRLACADSKKCKRAPSGLLDSILNEVSMY